MQKVQVQPLQSRKTQPQCLSSQKLRTQASRTSLPESSVASTPCASPLFKLDTEDAAHVPEVR